MKFGHSSLEFGTLNVQVSEFQGLNLEIQKMNIQKSKTEHPNLKIELNRIKLPKPCFFHE